MKLPAFQFYVGDWRKDMGVQSLSYHDRGVWFELLCMMHESESRGKLIVKGKPLNDDAVARLLGLDVQVCKSTIQRLLDSAVADRCPDTGALVSRRMVRDESLRKMRREIGKLGGNPSLVNQKRTKMDNQTTNQIHEDENEIEDNLLLEGESEGKPPPNPFPSLSDLEIPQHLRTQLFLKAWEDWMAFRKTVKASKNWNKLFQRQLTMLSDYPEQTAIGMLNQSLTNEYQGLFEMRNSNSKSASHKKTDHSQWLDNPYQKPAA